MATKGTDDLAYCYTNVSDDASWRATKWTSDPWIETPAYSMLPGFSLKMLNVDVFHVWHLGVARDMTASVLRVLAKSKYFRPGGTIQDQLSAASSSLKHFARMENLSLHLKRLSTANLYWRSNAYPETHCKGFDSYVMVAWLDWLLADANDVDPRVRTLVWAANALMGVWHHGGLFLRPDEVQQAQVVGGLFVRIYLELAGEAVNNRVRLWRLRPKFHLLVHLQSELRASRYNPTFGSTWMDEDAMKRFMKIKAKVHKLCAADRVIRRWLLSLRSKMENVREKKTDGLLAWWVGCEESSSFECGGNPLKGGSVVFSLHVVKLLLFR